MNTAPVNAPPLALSMGDPAGIGLELAFSLWLARKALSLPPFFLIGPGPLLAQAAALYAPDLVGDRRLAECAPADAAALFATHLPFVDVAGAAAVLRPGLPDPAFAPAILGAIETGVSMVAEGRAAALVTNPIAKKPLYDAGFRHPGHTEYLAELASRRPVWAEKPVRPVMMLAGGDLRVALATIHTPLAMVSAQLRAPADPIGDLAAIGRTTIRALRRDFGIDAPRLAFAGLNPHAGEQGAIGAEEIEIIDPAARLLQAEGFDVCEARPADSLFHAGARRGYDAVLAMYHDQGLIPVKMLDFWGGVNLTLGLPFVRTSPDHGTGFDLAGRGLARADSLLAALRLAAANAARRRVTA